MRQHWGFTILLGQSYQPVIQTRRYSRGIMSVQMHKKTTIVFFVGVILVFLYVVNFVIYDALALMFGIDTPAELLLIAIVLGIFSMSFIGASVLGNFYYNSFTRLYYKVSVVWMGLLAYLFMFLVVYGLSVALLGQTLPLLGAICLLSAVGVSVYGVIHARKIVVTEITVPIRNLPTLWQGKKVVWISDVHMGQILGPQFLTNVVNKINALTPDMVFIGGDLFDGTGAPDIRALIAPLANIKAPQGTYFITGNHEEFGGSNDTFISAVRAIGIKTLIDQMVVVDGLQLVGVDYMNASQREKFQEILERLSLDTKKPSLLLKHEPRDLDIAEGAGISFQISGHTHRAQMWPFRYITQRLYKGYDYGLKPYGKMQVYTSSGVGTWGPPLRVGTVSEIVFIKFKNAE
jgi:predicted MPP superfamily phosphohydrolase